LRFFNTKIRSRLLLICSLICFAADVMLLSHISVVLASCFARLLITAVEPIIQQCFAGSFLVRRSLASSCCALIVVRCFACFICCRTAASTAAVAAVIALFARKCARSFVYFCSLALSLVLTCCLLACSFCSFIHSLSAGAWD